MESLRIESKTLCKIVINDNGDYIEIDTEDVELPLKLEKMYEKINKLGSRIMAQEKIIDKQPDEKGKFLLSKNELAKANLLKEYYSEARQIVDELLGENACLKIFGKRNYRSMFNDLFESLEPIFEKLGVQSADISKAIIKKYSVNNNEELS